MMIMKAIIKIKGMMKLTQITKKERVKIKFKKFLQFFKTSRAKILRIPIKTISNWYRDLEIAVSVARSLKTL